MENENKLYYSKGSPFSLRILWAFDFLPERVHKLVSTKPGESANALKPVVDAFIDKHDLSSKEKKDHMLSLPLLLYSEQTEGAEDGSDKAVIVRDGFEILSFLCSKGSSAPQEKDGEELGEKEKEEFMNIFNEKREEIKDWNENLGTMLRFLRGRMIAKNYGDNIAKYAIPSWMNAIPGCAAFLTMIAPNPLKEKYYAVDSSIKAGECEEYSSSFISCHPPVCLIILFVEEVEANLRKANDILEKNEWLVENTFSYADIFLAT